MKNQPVTGEIPEGMSQDARETWPSQELIESWLGNALDFELRLGEHTPIPDDPESAAQARGLRDVLGQIGRGAPARTSKPKFRIDAATSSASSPAVSRW